MKQQTFKREREKTQKKNGSASSATKKQKTKNDNIILGHKVPHSQMLTSPTQHHTLVAHATWHMAQHHVISSSRHLLQLLYPQTHTPHPTHLLILARCGRAVVQRSNIMMSAMFKDSRRFAGVKRRRSGVGVNKRGGADKNDANAESEQLPIFKYKSELVRSVKENQITIVCGETGSGKSTQLPQFLASHFTEGCVVCTQPRRVAAITIAQRVAKERHVDLGSEVGYSIRFDDKSCSHTKIKYVTDGVLLREIMSDTELSKYSVVILDEAHERSLQTDILVGLLRQLLERKKTLRVIVMSATLEVRLFATYFNVPAESCIHIKGRQFPVQIMYTPSPEPDFIEACLLTCLQIHEESDGCDFGGVLVFLPGQEDIENLQLLLREHLMVLFKEKHERIYSMTAKVESTGDTNIEKARSQPNGVHVDFNDGDEVDFIVLPLYASMNPDDQLKAFQPSYPGKRKFVLATNIAETSVTIPGIQYVIDPGKMKSRRMHPATGADMLQVFTRAIFTHCAVIFLCQVAAVSQAQANQRAGRAGRERAGTCFRLFTEDTFEQLDESSIPEVQRIGIAQVILQLFVIGVENPLAFPFPSPPSTQSLQKTLKHLLRLGAISKEVSSLFKMLPSV